MRSLNRVELIGQVGTVPIASTTATGLSRCYFQLVTYERFSSKEGREQFDVDWHHVVAWDSLAKICREYLTLGTTVYAEGALKTRSVVDTNDITHTICEIVLAELMFLHVPVDTTADDAFIAGHIWADDPRAHRYYEPPMMPDLTTQRKTRNAQ